MQVTDALVFSEDVKDALRSGKPVVALESTIITHGEGWIQCALFIWRQPLSVQGHALVVVLVCAASCPRELLGLPACCQPTRRGCCLQACLSLRIWKRPSRSKEW